jgi:hypothetical protein
MEITKSGSKEVAWHISRVVIPACPDTREVGVTTATHEAMSTCGLSRTNPSLVVSLDQVSLAFCPSKCHELRGAMKENDMKKTEPNFGPTGRDVRKHFFHETERQDFRFPFTA